MSETVRKSDYEIQRQFWGCCRRFVTGADRALLYNALTKPMPQKMSSVDDVNKAFSKAFSKIKTGEQRRALYDAIDAEGEMHVENVEEAIEKLRRKAEEIAQHAAE